MTLPAENVHPIQAFAVGPSMMLAPNPVSIVEKAIERGITGADLKEIMDLQERFEARQATKAFNNALADAKSKLPVIEKNRLVDFKTSSGQTTYWHEDLAQVVDTVVPILSEYGLSHRWRLKGKPGEPITVTCIISHREGHAEENEMSAGADASGGKNAIQAMKSTVSYMERITLMASLGLASRKEDDDGRSAGGGPTTITALQLRELETLAAEVKADIPKFLKFFKIEEMAALPAKEFDRAKQMMEAKRSPL